MHSYTKKLIRIFLLAFVLNLIWENLQTPLYSPYRGGPIVDTTPFILYTFFDALFIALLALLFIKIPYLRERPGYSLPIGFLIAFLVERYALFFGWWSYSSLMPIIPTLETGLTPTIQLGVVSYVTYSIVGLEDLNGKVTKS